MNKPVVFSKGVSIWQSENYTGLSKAEGIKETGCQLLDDRLCSGQDEASDVVLYMRLAYTL